MMLEQEREHEDTKQDQGQDLFDDDESTETDTDTDGDDPLTQARSQARLATNTTNAPTDAQIARLRHGYSTLMRTLREERRELVEPQNSKLLDLIEQANELHVQVQRTVDATLDARFMAASADVGVEKLQTLPLAANPFTVKDLQSLVGRVVKAAGGVETAMERIGRVAGRHWRGVFGLETMVGLRGGRDGTVGKPPKTRAKRRLESTANGPIVKPTVLSAEDLQQGKAKETTDLVIEVYEQLEQLFQLRPKLALFNVVCDPTSFARSVELLFYVSFLVADGRVLVDVDADNVIWLSLSDGVDGDDGGVKRRHHQIVTLSESLWRRACDEHHLSEPLIKL